MEKIHSEASNKLKNFSPASVIFLAGRRKVLARAVAMDRILVNQANPILFAWMVEGD